MSKTCMKIETPEEYMRELGWDSDTLEKAIKFLCEWDKRGSDYYNKIKKIHADFDRKEREHYRNCINYWKKRLNHED